MVRFELNRSSAFRKATRLIVTEEVPTTAVLVFFLTLPLLLLLLPGDRAWIDNNVVLNVSGSNTMAEIDSCFPLGAVVVAQFCKRKLAK